MRGGAGATAGRPADPVIVYWAIGAGGTIKHLRELREVLDSAEAAAVQTQLAVLDRQMAER